MTEPALHKTQSSAVTVLVVVFDFLQVMKMREEAQAHVDALLQELRSGGSGNGSGGGRVVHQPSAAAVAIKAKLKNAVGVMQQGLVERDTEVRMVSKVLIAQQFEFIQLFASGLCEMHVTVFGWLLRGIPHMSCSEIREVRARNMIGCVNCYNQNRSCS